MGPRRGSKEIPLQTAGWPTVIMENQRAAGVAGIQIGEGSIADLDNPFACHLPFTDGEYPS